MFLAKHGHVNICEDGRSSQELKFKIYCMYYVQQNLSKFDERVSCSHLVTMRPNIVM